MACPLGIMIANKPDTSFNDCSKKLDIARDIMDVLNGKWKMEIILALLQFEKRRFKELQKDIPGISSKILSAVLKDLEANHIVKREVIDTFPIAVEYELTDYGKSLKQVLVDFVKLGINHRKEVMGGS
jgi:DNA-binding HxlR family transcriptional regulator